MFLNKFKNYLYPSVAAALLLTLPCFGQIPENQGCTPDVKAVQEQKVCAVHGVSLGMSEAEVKETLGEPSFKNKRKTSWHYRSVAGGVKGQSDPQIKFENKAVKSVVGSSLSVNGEALLKSRDEAEKIEKVLGPCSDKIQGAGDSILIYVYPESKLQIVTQKGRILVFGIGVE